MTNLSHFDESGAARMVDVGGKPETHRLARAKARLRMLPSTLSVIRGRSAAKGDVLEIARIAGIQAAKRTADLIPLCHTLPLTAVQIDYAAPAEDCLEIESVVEVFARTGVEMEALTAVSVTALTVYDMCKSIDRGMRIEQIHLAEKTGGQSGHYTA